MSEINVEKQLEKMLIEMRNLRDEQAEKQYQKHWSTINLPFTLYEGLAMYKKYELDEIRKTLQIPNASSLKKEELILKLQESIPAYIEKISLLWDAERFNLLKKIAINNGSVVSPRLEAMQIEYFRSTGMIYTGIYEEKQVLGVPNELLSLILELKDNEVVKRIISRNTEWIKLTRGLLFYYGTLSIGQLFDFLEKYTKEKIPFKDFFDVIHHANLYRKEISIDEQGYSNIRVFDSKRVLEEHQMRASLEYFPFSKQQLLLAGEPGFVDRNQSYLRFVNFLTENFEISRDGADNLVEECVYATRIGDSPNNILEFLSYEIEFDSLDTVRAVTDQTIDLMNQTREWFLKGHTSSEVMEKENEKFLPFSNANKPKSASSAKIGRNEPCPCGSGKKYKRCCGK